MAERGNQIRILHADLSHVKEIAQLIRQYVEKKNNPRKE